MIYMSEISLIAIYGKSASGKDTYLNELIKEHPNLNKILLATSRPPREKEIDGTDYLFVKDKEIKRDKGKYLWPIEFNGWTYAIVKESIKQDKINIGIFNIYWMTKLFEDCGKTYDLIAIEVFEADKTRLLRSLNRENYPDCAEICRRFLADEKDFSNIDFCLAKKLFNEQYPRYNLFYLAGMNKENYCFFLGWMKQKEKKYEQSEFINREE